jgi:hypothetical protein
MIIYHTIIVFLRIAAMTPAEPISSLRAHSSEVGIPPDPPWPGEQDAAKIEANHPPPKKLSPTNSPTNNKQTTSGKTPATAATPSSPSNNRSDSTNYNKSKMLTPK